MNVGAYLVSKSPLSSGTALQHLLAMQMGGTGGTVFAAMFAVQIDTPRLTLAQRAKTRASETAVSGGEQETSVAQSGKFSVAVLTQPERVDLLVAGDEAALFTGAERTTFFTRAGNERMTIAPADFLEMN